MSSIRGRPKPAKVSQRSKSVRWSHPALLEDLLPPPSTPHRYLQRLRLERLSQKPSLN